MLPGLVKSRVQTCFFLPQQRAHCQQERFSARSEIPAILARLTASLSANGFSPTDLFGVRLAVEEALVNAVEHGHQGDPDKVVHVENVYLANSECLLITIEDEGPGFDVKQVADPIEAQNLYEPRGRGLLLMKSYMTWVRFSDRGNRLTMCKRRSRIR